MATKTISIDMKAYELLTKARRHPKESFSQVIHRAQWTETGRTCEAFLDTLAGVIPMSSAEIRALDQAQNQDRPPKDRWTHD